MTGPTLAQQAAAVEREVRMRQRLYPRWVEGGRMRQAEADAGIAVMEAASATLRRLADAEAAKRDLFGGAAPQA